MPVHQLSPGSKVIAAYGRMGPHGRQWVGTVLRQDDPRAWENTIAFPGRRPTQAEVREHLKGLGKMKSWIGPPHDTNMPVAWEFGKVYWENPKRLRSLRSDPYGRPVKVKSDFAANVAHGIGTLMRAADPYAHRRSRKRPPKKKGDPTQLKLPSIKDVPEVPLSRAEVAELIQEALKTWKRPEWK